MGHIFDKKTAQIYDSWYRSSQGRVIDGSIEQMLVALLRPKPKDRVLDIGCGSGNHLIVFNRLGLDVSGIDASPYMIQKAEERLGHRCSLKTGTAEALPFGDNEFDLAVFVNSLEFMDDPLQVLREAGRVASKKVFIGVINSLSWSGLSRRVQGYLGHPLFSRARFYSLWQIKSLLQMAYGPVSVSWGCIGNRPSTGEKAMASGKGSWDGNHSPFGFFLGFSAALEYRMKTDNLPLKIKLKKASHSLMGAKTLEDLKRDKGGKGDERGLSV